jgi:hypothetical protein
MNLEEKGLSTDKAFHTFKDKMLCKLNKMHISRIPWDLAKASMCVNHKLSLSKPNLYGIRGIAGH